MIELEPIATLGYWRNGEALLAAGRRAEAHANLERAVELGDTTSMWILGAEYLVHGDDEQAITWFEKYSAATGADPEEVRPFIENVRDPDTGKSFLDQWVEETVANASNLDERRQAYYWYLLLDYIDDYWLGIEALGGEIITGWTNADTLEQSGMVFHRADFVKHPKYLPRAKATSMTDLWDKRGPPDHCNKVDGDWVCE